MSKFILSLVLCFTDKLLHVTKSEPRDTFTDSHGRKWVMMAMAKSMHASPMNLKVAGSLIDSE